MSALPGALEWDYSALAEHYRFRAPYAAAALAQLFERAALSPGSDCVDIGAGTGNLTAALVAHGLRVIAVEPNDSMRAIGERTVPQARWLARRGEATGLPRHACRLLAFGSSFNVIPASAALEEAARLVRPGGWLACLWNHRDLDDPLQVALQEAIRKHVPGYRHGRRREDPRPLFAADGRFGDIGCIEAAFRHVVTATDFVAGFRAHATLVRQAGDALPQVLEELARVLAGSGRITVPFVTRIFVARRSNRPE